MSSNKAPHGLAHEAGWHWPRLHMILWNPAPWSQTHVDSAVLWLHVLDSKLHLLLPGAQCSLKASCASLTCGFIHAMLEHLKQSEISYSNSRGVKVWRSTCAHNIPRNARSEINGRASKPMLGEDRLTSSYCWPGRSFIAPIMIPLPQVSPLWFPMLHCRPSAQMRESHTEPLSHASCFVSTKMYQVLLCHIFFTLKGLNLTLKNLLQVKYG